MKSGERTWGQVIGYSAALSAGIGLAFGAVGLWSMLVEGSGARSRILVTVLDGTFSLSPVLVRDLAAFFVVVIGLHLMVGLAACANGWLTEIACRTKTAQRRQLATLWILVLFAGIVLWSAGSFPRTLAGQWYGDLANAQLAGVSMAEAWWIAVFAVVVGLAGVGAVRTPKRSASSLIVIAGAALVGAGALPTYTAQKRASEGSALAAPNILLIGIDSLRLEALTPSQRSLMPSVSAFLDEAAVLADATTPLARTFPAWISILSGRHPAAVGVACNLTPRSQLLDLPTFAKRLRDRGYYTAFSTDEVRFSNIDETYGFDTVVSPRIGAADFLIGELGDIPLLNIVAGTGAGRALLPHLHANRAAAAVYEPGDFVTQVTQEIAVPLNKPALIIVHLTAPHWPYYTSTSRVPANKTASFEGMHRLYRESLVRTDQQFRQVLDWARQSGLLENAIVLALSDHGEAFRRPGDASINDESIERIPGLPLLEFGHGSSVLSETQFQVLMGFRGYGSSSTLVSAGRLESPATLEDIAPTLLSMLGLESGQQFDGISLAPVLRYGDNAGRDLWDRVRYTETGFNGWFANEDSFDGTRMAARLAQNYEVDDRTGYVQMRDNGAAEVLRRKQRAAFDKNWLLASIPVEGGVQRFVLVDRNTGDARLVDQRSVDTRTRHLWSALRSRHGDQIGDLPLIAEPFPDPLASLRDRIASQATGTPRPSSNDQVPNH